MSDQSHRRPEDGAANHAEDALEGLRLGRPDPALRHRTLRAVRAALAPTPEPVARWRAWRVEAALVAAIAACALPLPVLGRLPAELRPSGAPSLVADVSEATLDPLDLDDLEPYIRVRLALARRDLDPKPRYSSHDFTYRNFDVF